MPNPDLRSACRGLSHSQILETVSTLSDAEAEAILYDWETWARPDQLPPAGQWTVAMYLAGRGWGKTRVGAEIIRQDAKSFGRIALVGATAADVRDVMVEGESGILAISPPNERPTYEPSKRRLTWPNGAVATTYTAEEPDRLRGPQHERAWADEVAAWKYPGAWDMLMFGLRLGRDPRAVATTTPKQTPHMRAIKAAPGTVIIRGRTYDNAANLAPSFLTAVTTRYAGTRLGRQELDGEDLDDNPNAMWQRARIDELRVTKHPDLVRVVVAVDPAASATEESAETGIIVAGLGTDGHGYILDDCTVHGSPNAWGRAAVTAYHKHRADRIVAEVNNGGDMVIFVLETVDANVPTAKVHASRGKATRAEPVAALYEQGRVHHVGSFPHLEDQLCTWEPGQTSPDRLDALVWALTELMLEQGGEWGFVAL